MAEESRASPFLSEDMDSISSISVSSITTMTTVLTDSSYWLEKRPLLSVVCSVIRTNRWHQLGIQLNVDCHCLDEIDRDNPSTGLKRTRMFEEWLKTQPNATNRQLLNALRLKVIGEDTMAEEYEERIKSDPSVLTTRTDLMTLNHQVTDAVHIVVDSPKNTDSTVSLIQRKVRDIHDLASHAMQLQEKYYELLEITQDYATQHSKVELIKSKLKSILKDKSSHQSHTIAQYCTQINAITTVDEVFQFLIDNHFVGYLNFQLLEYLSSERICGKEGHEEMEKKLSEYKKCYGEFIEEPFFGQILQVFDEYPHLNPSTIIGLPIIVVTLTMKWQKRSKKDLEEWLPFLRENQALLQSMGYKCILITYAVFPIDLLNIMDFLNDPNNIKTLKDNGISIETPSHTLEIEKLLREDERKQRNNPSFTSTEDLSLQQEKVCRFSEDQVTELTDSENKRMVQLRRPTGRYKTKGLSPTNNRDSGYYTSCENSPATSRVYTNDDT